jgi:cytochrome c556
LGDFAKISRSAEKLVQLTRTEEWMVYKTPRYEVHSNEFRRAAEMILQKSEKKNLDGVAYAYLDLTMTCVRCHQYVREVKDARLPGVNPEFLFARR